MRKMVKAGRAVKMDPANPLHARLPDGYLQHGADIETPVLLVTGDRNRVFTDSNVVCHRALEQVAPGRHELAILPGYGHQDPFMGAKVAQEVFPVFLGFLEKHRSVTATRAPAAVGV
ncbi:MAG TPA: hypothetical protein VKP64_01060 [Mycobacteriales bacterium]|nr:hypothetical protein [Mycobacteriales bacterium]